MITRSASVLADVRGCPHVQVRSYYSLEVKSGIRGKNSIMPKKHECIWIQSRNKSDEPERISEWRHWCFHRTRNVKGSDSSEIQNVSGTVCSAAPALQKNENCHFFLENNTVEYLLLPHRTPKSIASSVICLRIQSRTWKKRKLAWLPSTWMVYATDAYHISIWY